MSSSRVSHAVSEVFACYIVDEQNYRYGLTTELPGLDWTLLGRLLAGETRDTFIAATLDLGELVSIHHAIEQENAANAAPWN